MSGERTNEGLQDIVTDNIQSEIGWQSKAEAAQAHDALDELTRRANETDALRADNEVLREALDMLGGMNAPCQPWCIPHRDKDGCQTSYINGKRVGYGPCVPNVVKHAITEAKRRIAERSATCGQ